jgi:hypothetical protein
MNQLQRLCLNSFIDLRIGPGLSSRMHFISSANGLRWLLAFLFWMAGTLSFGESPDGNKEDFAGHWALKMSNGAAGWMAISKDKDGWAGELRTVGEPRVMKNLRYADGKLTFRRALRIGPPEYPGGKPFVHLGKRLPPLPPKT